MKKIGSLIIISSFLFCNQLFATPEIEAKLQMLEAKVNAMEESLSLGPLKDCRLSYAYVGTRYNSCGSGAFAVSVVELNDGTMKLECGRYRIRCYRD